VLPSQARAGFSPVRFFSADAANLHLISRIAPAQEGEVCQTTIARGDARLGMNPMTNGAGAAIVAVWFGRLPETELRGEDGA
jgi:hypothetical protein